MGGVWIAFLFRPNAEGINNTVVKVFDNGIDASDYTDGKNKEIEIIHEKYPNSLNGFYYWNRCYFEGQEYTR